MQDQVYAGKEMIDDSGSYAFWVGDEGVKARFNQPELVSKFPSLAKQSFNLSAPERWSIESIDDDNDPFSPSAFEVNFDAAHSQLEDILYSSEAGMVASSTESQDILDSAFRKRFHDLSLSSLGLLTNARDGGLKQDLSLAFEMDEVEFDSHTDFSFGTGGPLSLYTTTNPDNQPVKHLWVHESMDAIEDGPAYYKGPTWHLLRDYYNLYYEVDNPTVEPTLIARNVLPLPARGSNNLAIPRLYDNGQNSYNTGIGANNTPLLRPRTLKVAPVVARVQLVLSVTAVPVDVSSVIKPMPIAGENYYKLRIILDPVVTLYNPYTVNLWFQGVTINVNKIVSSLQWELNGEKSNVFSLEEIFGISFPGFDLQNNRDFNLIDKGIATMSIGAPEGVTLAPGELVVYSPGNESPEPFFSEIDAAKGWPLKGGFYVDSLDPDPSIRDANWNDPGIHKRDYKEHELEAGDPAREDDNVTSIVIGTASDQIAFDFEVGNEAPRWVSLLGDRVSDRYRTAGKQMAVEAFLVEKGAYSHRFETDKTFVADRLQLYSRLRSNLDFGDLETTGNIGRRPEDGVFRFSDLVGVKKALGQIDMRLKTEDDVLRPYPMFALSSMNAFTTNPESAWNKIYGVINPPYAVIREPLQDVRLALALEPDSLRGFWGPTRDFSSKSTNFVTGTDIPKAPLVSLGQLQHLDIAIYGYEPSHAIGNSFASPWVNLDQVELPDRANIDISFLTNNALWDGYYFSTITPQDAAVFTGNKRRLEEVINDFTGASLSTGAESVIHLPNPRIEYINDSATGLRNAILEADGSINRNAHRESAGYLGVKGAFNVNSTSVEAWKALFSSLGEGRLAKLDSSGSFVAGENTTNNRISRYAVPLGDPGDKWAGYSALSDEEITRLAEETVKQVKLRGPFFSMAHFVNRKITSDSALSKAGALQTAINEANINGDSLEVIASQIDNFYPESIAANVTTDTGAAGFLTQADLLSQLAPFLNVRSDTFTIRAYGESIDQLTDRVIGRAWCEAIVQRVPEYIEPDIDDTSSKPYDESGNPVLNSSVNQDFGRQYRIIAFRWLNKDEV
ncbi:hypothetical protein [Rubellicoccus peritrichatus]|uniref:Uncharacterized protein n=1 Tax=Rubellicoccus peritrichatus TaxID=3080537 RepID=A0AAQ3L6A7_9BACT|nr:hypothetical protein [Puniceicoccus sp. CR14]WOO40289.1 hypothetical protein RZN69_16845 [Puniceicoccus sp. CR14]